MRYLPHTNQDVAAMLEKIGLPSLDSLFESIPDSLRLKRGLDLSHPLNELELIRSLEELASQNSTIGDGKDHLTSFLGGGIYHHHIPTAVDHLVSRSEFFTAYTPYQPEVSQGTLLAIYEFQSMVCRLLGMEVANASMYDGATATAEAALMAGRLNRKGGKILVSDAVHPEYRDVLGAYLGDQVVSLPHHGGQINIDELEERLDSEPFAAVVVQHPNFFGILEDIPAIAQASSAKGAKLIVTFTEAMAYGLLKSPGEMGADVACGEGQSFGIPMAYGGPSLGLFATRKAFARSMPGRLVGLSTDDQNRQGYVLTMSTREQHIRRERATSNICTNEALCALMATIYLSLAGKEGLKEVALTNLSVAKFLQSELVGIPGVELAFDGSTFNEFVVRLPGKNVADVLSKMVQEENILGGLALGKWYPDLSDCYLVTATEMNTKEQIGHYMEALTKAMR